MRSALSLLALLAACKSSDPPAREPVAEPPAPAPENLYAEMTIHQAAKRYQDALRAGDGEAFVAVHCKPARAGVKVMVKAGLTARPSLTLKPRSVLVQKKSAAIFAERRTDLGGDEMAMRLGLEDERWCVDSVLLSEEPIDRLKFFPPETGTFMEASAPWKEVARRDWRSPPESPLAGALQAATDESFLYVRLDFGTPIPAVGSQVEQSTLTWKELGLPSPPDIDLWVEGDKGQVASPPFRLQLTPSVVSRSAGKQLKRSVDYELKVVAFRSARATFQTAATDRTRLVGVDGTALVARVPIALFGNPEQRKLELIFGGKREKPYRPKRFQASSD